MGGGPACVEEEIEDTTLAGGASGDELDDEMNGAA